MARNFGKRPSEIWGICDQGVALEFDRLCNYRLMIFDSWTKQQEAEAFRSQLPFGDAPSKASNEFERLLTEARPN
jgi:hypothetical protein